MSFTYSQLLANLANTLVVDPTNADYLAILPTIIDDGEQSIYRGLDLLSTIVRDSTGTLTANSRIFVLPQSQGRFVVTESISIMLPDGSRSQMVPTSREFIDAIYGGSTAQTSPSIPEYYGMLTDQTILVGPPPDANYGVEVIGTIRPTPLSASNPTTYLTLYLPDLFFCECLIFGYGYLKDFGATTDDPQASASWVSHYKGLWDSANTEEMRKKYASQAWTSKSPATIATPPRA